MASLDDIDTMRDNRDVDGLIQALGDEDEFVRTQAVLSLGAIADPKAKDPVARLRTEDSSASVREAAETAYKWLVGRLEEVETTKGTLKSPPPR